MRLGQEVVGAGFISMLKRWKGKGGDGVKRGGASWVRYCKDGG